MDLREIRSQDELDRRQFVSEVWRRSRMRNRVVSDLVLAWAALEETSN